MRTHQTATMHEVIMFLADIGRSALFTANIAYVAAKTGDWINAAVAASVFPLIYVTWDAYRRA